MSRTPRVFRLGPLVLLALIVALGVWPGEVRAGGCKANNQVCQTPMSCCSRNCAKPSLAYRVVELVRIYGWRYAPVWNSCEPSRSRLYSVRSADVVSLDPGCTEPERMAFSSTISPAPTRWPLDRKALGRVPSSTPSRLCTRPRSGVLLPIRRCLPPPCQIRNRPASRSRSRPESRR